MYKPRWCRISTTRAPASAADVEPQLVRELGLRPEHVEFVKQAMAGVTKEGTGARAFAGAQYTSGGKTGTAQVVAMKQNEKYDEAKVAERLRDHSLYIAFAPAGQSEDRARRGGGERRLRRARRRADRAHRARLLTCSASCRRRRASRRRWWKCRPTRKSD